MKGLKRRGRPVNGEPRTFRCGVRMNKEEHEILNYLIEKTEMSRTDIVNQALKMMYNLEKYID